MDLQLCPSHPAGSAGLPSPAGKRAVVTGGSRGIGYAVAAALLAEGADVAVVARNSDTLDDAAARLRAGARGRSRPSSRTPPTTRPCAPWRTPSSTGSAASTCW